MPDHKKPVCCSSPMRRMTIKRPQQPGRRPVGYLCLTCKKVIVSMDLEPSPAKDFETERYQSTVPTCANCSLLEYVKRELNLTNCGLEKVCKDEWFWQYWLPMEVKLDGS